MIVRDEVIPRLLAASPSFAARWATYVAEPSYEPGLLYVDLGEFARHLLDLHRRAAAAELSAALAEVERLHTDGDTFVREAATVGLLEALQNNAEHQGVDPEDFRPFLGSESRRWWDGLNRFWAGEAPRVDRVDAE